MNGVRGKYGKEWKRVKILLQLEKLRKAQKVRFRCELG